LDLEDFMSLGRRAVALALLTLVVSLSGFASGAMAQTGQDSPHKIALAPPEVPVSNNVAALDNSLDFGSLRLGNIPLQYRFGFAMCNWLQPMLSRMDARMAPAVWSSRHSAAGAVWARKRF
jgi:hypothetical protein